MTERTSAILGAHGDELIREPLNQKLVNNEFFRPEDDDDVAKKIFSMPSHVPCFMLITHSGIFLSFSPVNRFSGPGSFCLLHSVQVFCFRAT